MRGTRRRAFAGGIAVAVSLLLMPAAALAEVRTASSVDPPGFPGNLRPVVTQRDIVATELTYDTQGTAYAKVTLAAPPDEAAMKAGVTLLLGQWEDEPEPGCVFGLDAHASTSRTHLRLLGGAKLSSIPTLTRVGNTMTGLAKDPHIANQAWDCGSVLTTDLTNPDGDGDASQLLRLAPTATPPPQPPATQPGQPKMLRRAINRCKRKHKGSKRSVKRARKRCIERAQRKYGQASVMVRADAAGPR